MWLRQEIGPNRRGRGGYRGGGRYVSVICGNLLFHNMADHGPEATSPQAVEKFSNAYIAVARNIAGSA